MLRHGGWLTFGNVDLHLIKGRPCVHADDDLIVGHMALVVSDMTALKDHLKKKGIQYRTNISVPNPDDKQTGRADQVGNVNMYENLQERFCSGICQRS